MGRRGGGLHPPEGLNHYVGRISPCSQEMGKAAQEKRLIKGTGPWEEVAHIKRF